MNTPVGEINTNIVRSGLFGLLKLTAAAITSAGVIIWLIWYAIEPRVTEYLNEREAPLKQKVEELGLSLNQLNGLITKLQPGFIEFRGKGLLSDKESVKAGETVSIVYQLKQNLPCATTVQAQFIAGSTGSVDTSMTYTFPATQAPITRSFITFRANVRIPADMPPGRWSYAPILTPQNCNNYGAIVAPLSEFFTVTE